MSPPGRETIGFMSQMLYRLSYLHALDTHTQGCNQIIFQGWATLCDYSRTTNTCLQFEKKKRFQIRTSTFVLLIYYKTHYLILPYQYEI